jgi:hypothetical protein
MKFHSKIFLALFIAAIISIAVLGYFRYKQKTSSAKPIISIENNSPTENTQETTQLDSVESNIYNQDVQQNQTTVPAKDSYLSITSADCDSQCEFFKDNQQSLEYCNQVCGLTSQTEATKKDCNELSNIEKDYCIKDEAVSKKDLALCDKIKDSNIKKTCQDRITEDIIEQIQQ